MDHENLKITWKWYHLEELDISLKEKGCLGRVQSRGRSYLFTVVVHIAGIPNSPLLVVWPLSTWLYFKLQCGGGGVGQDHYQQSIPDASTENLNTILCTDRFANSLPTTFLLDSGAVVSAIQFQSLQTKDHAVIIKMVVYLRCMYC